MREPINERIPVDSAVIAAVSYAAHAALDIEFTSGTTYRYFAVPERVFHEFLAAESKGAFFNRRILLPVDQGRCVALGDRR